MGAFRQSKLTSLIQDREEQVFLVLTLLIGVLVGLTVVAFIVLTDKLGARLYPPGGAAWRRFLVPVAGSLAMGYLLQRHFPEARGSGVPQTKAAMHLRDGFISLRTVLGKFFCTSATVASGIPLGREGPAVQVGGGIASLLGRRLGLGPEKVKALLPVGAAAAIAAAFNTPVAAVLFSLEEVVGDLHAPVMGSVVLASAASWITLRLFLGNEPLFHVPQYDLVHPAEFVIYAVLGVAIGLVSVLFTKLIVKLRAGFLRLPEKTKSFQPLAGGLLVGLLALPVPQVLGVGYSYVGAALNGNMLFHTMALLVLLKLLTVSVSYGSGNAGGIFGPSLFMGAMLGGTIGNVAHHFLPAYTAAAGAYALVGMGAAFAGIIRAPMTSVMMIFETTHDYAVIVPLMIANLLSFFVARKLQRKQIYEILSLQDGIHLPDPELRARMSDRRVVHVMRPVEEMISSESTLSDAMRVFHQSASHSWPVVDDGGLIGMLVRTGLEQAVADREESETVGKLAPSLVLAYVHKDQPLPIALDRMGVAGLDRLPVVSRDDTRRIEGIVTLNDILSGYGLQDHHSPLGRHAGPTGASASGAPSA